MLKVLIIGIDGLDPIYLSRWMREGCLPTFKSIVTNGVLGKLKSTIPPVTLPAWPSMFTGKNPGKLGVFDFFQLVLNENKYELKLVNLSQWKGDYVWDYIGESGQKVGLINIPEFYKSYNVNGFMINTHAFMSSYPENLLDDIYAKIPIFKDYSENSFEDIKKIEKNTLIDLEINKYVTTKYELDLLIHVFRILDVVSHKTTDIEIIKKYYILMDNLLDNLLKNTNYRNMLIVSDHGIRQYRKKFYLNTYLEKQGLLKLKRDVSEKKLRSIAYILLNIFPSLYNVIKKYTKPLSKIIGYNIQPTLEELFNSIDWDNSKVFAYALTNSNFVGVWFLKEIENYSELIYGIRDPITGENIVKKIYDKHELYHGALTSNLPDLVVELNEKYLATSELGSIIVRNTNNYAHQLYGTLIAHGKDIHKNEHIDEYNILDIAPTILHLMDVSDINDLDGKIINSLFSDHE